MSKRVGWVRDGTLVSPAGQEIDVRCGETWDNSITVKGPRAEEIVPLVIAAPALAEALGNFVDYYTQAGIGACEEGHDDDEDEAPFSGDERYNVRQARAALRKAGVE